eukprot:gene6208-13243_t
MLMKTTVALVCFAACASAFPFHSEQVEQLGKKCVDTPDKALAKFDVASCKELYGEILASGGSCKTNLGDYLDKAGFRKKTLGDLCCASCNVKPGPGGSTTASPAEAACQKVDAVCRQDLMQVKYLCFSAPADDIGADPLPPADALLLGLNKNTTACPSPSQKIVTKKEEISCTRCIAKVFGDNYDACSCCILPILKDAGLAIKDIKALDQYFPDTKCQK